MRGGRPVAALDLLTLWVITRTLVSARNGGRSTDGLEVKPAPEKVYPRAPMGTPTPQTALLFRDYQRDRERAVAERRTARETTTAASKT